MYKRKSISVLVIGVMVLCLVVIIALVYAGFTGQLNISGQAVQRKSNWDIHFEDLSNITTTGSAKVLSQPALNGTTTIEDYSVSTTSPGDTISFTFKVTNDGNYNASISSVSVGIPECSGIDTVSNTKVCSKLTYSLTYEGGATVQTGDMLYAKDYVTMKVTLTYAEFNDDSLLPTDDVAISNLAITINYQQSSSALVQNNGSVANNKVYHQGEKITLNNEDYYIIANSGSDKDYVFALKENPLTIAEVNLYGGVGTESNHVNKTSIGTAGGSVYGTMAYYTSTTCNSSDRSGCTNDYDESDIKYVVDNWALDKFSNNELKEVEGYSARLLKYEEYNSIPNNYSWRNLTGVLYWAIEPYLGTEAYLVGYGGYNVEWGNSTVRPVIAVRKSVLANN